MTPDELKALADDIKTRLTAVGQTVSDEALEARIGAAVDTAIAAKEPFQRRPLFGDARLQGSKFGRAGMGVADIEFLHGVLSSAGKRISPDLDNAFNALTEGRYQDVVSARLADQHDLDEAFTQGRFTPGQYQEATRTIDQMYRGRAMDTAESGYGSQLIGAQYIGELWAGARAQSKVFAQIPVFQMDQATAYLPVAGAVPELYFVGESTTYDAADYGTVKTGSQRVQVTPAKFVIHQKWSGEMEEDSILPYVPFLREQQARSLAHYSDSLVLNGDTTNADTLNINSYDANPADTKHYLAFDGLRHAPLVDLAANSASGSGTGSYDKIIALKSLMVDPTYLDDWGHPADPNDLIFVTDPQTGDEIALYDEVITVDKYGPAATVITGEVTKIGRHPLISSIAFPLTNNDGMVKSSGNTYGNVLAFNRRGFVIAMRRAVKIETERLLGTDQTRILLSTRFGFGRYTPTGAASGIEAAALLYNI